MRMRPRDDAKLLIITWRIDVLKWAVGQLATEISLTNRRQQAAPIAVV
jgi:hypothetical protein